MTSKYETETDLQNTSTERSEQSPNSEAVYERLVAYGFIRRCVEGKTVADVGWREIGQGTRLLAETAESVVGLVGPPEAVDRASAVHSASNVSYGRVDLPELPYDEDHFDVVVAFGVVENLEHPEGLVSEARRVLKQDGSLVVSVPDKQTNANSSRKTDGRREMYVSEFRELLERHFGRVRLYRHGAVAGGFVFPASGEATEAPVETARLSLTDHLSIGTEAPITRSIIAVCSDVEIPGQEEQPYLLLDRDRRVFDECEEHAEDIELLRGEIRQMQETEVQAFLDALKLQQSLSYMLTRYRIHLRTHLRNVVVPTRRGIARRLASTYQWLRANNRDSD